MDAMLKAIFTNQFQPPNAMFWHIGRIRERKNKDGEKRWGAEGTRKRDRIREPHQSQQTSWVAHAQSLSLVFPCRLRKMSEVYKEVYTIIITNYCKG